MACADPDMDIHGDGEEYEEPSTVEQQYMATEFLPEEKGPLYDLLQKQPAVLGVRVFQKLIQCKYTKMYECNHM